MEGEERGGKGGEKLVKKRGTLLSFGLSADVSPHWVQSVTRMNAMKITHGKRRREKESENMKFCENELQTNL